ncbi:MAG TPA: threonine--tRNA ligase [Candidatus Saccharimonadales bacterium]|nr:threonine--tRNA ligase [Candidatus Saccharimonadales bacterium]
MAEVKKTKENDLHAMRHSMSHILATAMQSLYKGVKFGVGPVIENGFYYDFDLGETTLSPEDLPKVEAEMREVIKADYPFESREHSLEEAIGYFEKHEQPYKVELVRDIKKHGTTVMSEIEGGVAAGGDVDKITTVTFYKIGPFIDLCRGGHLKSTGGAGAFKLTKVSSAYWRGDEKNPQLQRIYGVAFATEAELNKYLEQVEEAEKRDHRKLGSQLDIFVQSEIVGAGLPLFTPNGTAMINAMMNLVRDINTPDGYEEVRTGHVTRTELYKISGHLDKFGDDLFVVEAGEDKLAMKPMNCPHHTQLYDREMRSYRDLPIKYAEFSTLHRNEVKGALGGLTRVRALTQDDAHAFVRPDQVEGEIEMVVKQVDRLLSTYHLDYHVRLSLRDPKDMKAYLGDAKVWDKAEAMLRDLAGKFKMKFVEAQGEAAFYGPKMDFMAVDAIGREWQVSTIQLDFQQPERFDLSFVDEKGVKQRPVMIHRALNGTFERMLGILIEHYAGNFPVWLAPEQVRLATVNDSKEITDKAYEMRDALKIAGLRTELDVSSESVGKKIRAASLAKVPYTIVVGEREAAGEPVSVRLRADMGEKDVKVKFDKFIETVKQEVADRVGQSSL